MQRFANPIVYFFLFTGLLLSCSTPRPKGKTEAEVLYKEAKSYMDEGLYDLARQRLQNLRSKYPYSFYSTHAELLQADILFKEEKFAEAAAAYEVFRDFHPKHEKIHYVLYRLAESFYQQLPSTYDRDLSPAREAIRYYQELIAQYPNSDHVDEARKKIVECQGMLRKKQKYIADFYFKTEVFDSARYRYLDILKNFSNEELRNHSMIRVVKSSAELGDEEKCLVYYNKFKDRVSNKTARKKLNAAKEGCP